MDSMIRAACVIAGGLGILGAAIMLAAVAIAEDDAIDGVKVIAVVVGVFAAALIGLAVLNRLPPPDRRNGNQSAGS